MYMRTYIRHHASGTQDVRFLTTVFLLDLHPLAGNPFGIPDFLLDLHPLAGNPSRNPASSVRESDRFRRELTESEFSQRSRYSRKSKNATALTQNRLVRFQMSLNTSRGAGADSKCPRHMEPLPGIQNPTKIGQ